MSKKLLSVGRFVHYKLSKYDVTEIDSRSPQNDAAGRYNRNPVCEGAVYSAQVVATFGGGDAANLIVQLDGYAQYWACSRGEGDEPGQWSWPPRV